LPDEVLYLQFAFNLRRLARRRGEKRRDIDRPKEALSKFGSSNREAVVQFSPALPRFGGYPGVCATNSSFAFNAGASYDARVADTDTKPEARLAQ